MNNVYIKTFIKVAELMNFSQAAHQLGYAQSTVTIQIKQLEEELGVQLFDRFGKKICISQQGKAFLPFAHKIVKLEMEAYEVLNAPQEPTGTLQIGIVESLCSTIYKKIIETFLTQYPQVDLIVKIATTLELLKMLHQNQIDVMATLDKKVVQKNFFTTIEKEEKIIFLCSRTHHFATKKAPLYLQDIVEEKFIFTEKYCNYREVFEEILMNHNLQALARLEIGNTNLILDLVKKNIGITILPEICLSHYTHPDDLTIIHVQDCPMTLFTQIIYNKNKWISPAQQAFIDLTRQYFSS